MKTFKRPVLEEKIMGIQCEQYKTAMYKHLLEQYYGRITEAEVHSYFKCLIKEQDEMGFWGFVKPREVSADIRVCYFYEPTYIAVATMMFYWYTQNEAAKAIEGFEESLRKGIQASIGRGFKGSGYDEVRGIAQTFKYLALGKVDLFVEKYPDLCQPFSDQYKAAKAFLNTLLKEGNTKNAWGENFKYRIEEALTLLEETSTQQKEEAWIGLFVYGTLMEGQRNHNHYLSDALFEGDYYLKGYANYHLESYPGIISSEGSKVIGELYRIKRKNLEAVDYLEGEGILYKRQQVQVVSMKNDRVYRKTEVMTYVYLGDVKGKRKVEGKWSIK